MDTCVELSSEKKCSNLETHQSDTKYIIYIYLYITLHTFSFPLAALKAIGMKTAANFYNVYDIM